MAPAQSRIVLSIGYRSLALISLVRAELIKLLHQRGALFWGFFALPFVLILLAIALDGSVDPGKTGTIEIHPVRVVLHALAMGGNPIAHLFFAVGAGALFALEYRYATWRLLVPRRRRSGLLLAKLIAFLVLASFSLLLVSLGNLISIYAVPWFRGGHPFTTEPLDAGIIAIASTFVVSILELAALAAMVALMAVLTRSTLGAILPPFLLAIGSSTAEAYLGNGPGSLIALPGAANDQLRSILSIGFDGNEALPSAQPVLAVAIAIAWFVLPLGIALFLFARQDLAGE